MEENTATVTEEKSENIENKSFIKINNDVISAISAIAATEVEGVCCMDGGITSEIIGKFGVKDLSSGAVVSFADGKVNIELSIVVDCVHNIPEVGKKVQERVKSVVESMTGYNTGHISVKVAGVNID